MKHWEHVKLISTLGTRKSIRDSESRICTERQIMACEKGQGQEQGQDLG